MPQFILNNTTDSVAMPSAHGGTVAVRWNGLDLFTQGYIEALFFTESSFAYTSDEWHSDECLEAQTQGTADGSIPGDVGFSDLSPGALDTIVTDCADFQRDNAETLARAYDHASGYDETRAGADYWYTRNGHGVGFWDRDLGEIGDALTTAAQYSEVNVSFETDGKIHL